jgi:hypothetical protein
MVFLINNNSNSDNTTLVDTVITMINENKDITGHNDESTRQMAVMSVTL